ncbi:hypothetical protein GCM10010441_01170 [Kitasatospora paracochleata]
MARWSARPGKTLHQKPSYHHINATATAGKRVLPMSATIPPSSPGHPYTGHGGTGPGPSPDLVATIMPHILNAFN